MAAESQHTYSPSCAFYDNNTDVTTAATHELSPVKAQFFYVSALPIDDPLSPVPPAHSDKSSNVPVQPFSIKDNAALEEAWRESQRQRERTHNMARPASRGLNRMTSFPTFQGGLKSPGNTSPTAESSTHGMFASIPDRKRSSTATSLPTTKEGQSDESNQKSNSPRLGRRSSIRSSNSRSRKSSHVQSENQVILGSGSDNRPLDTKELQSVENERKLTERKHVSPLRYRLKPGRSSPETTSDVESGVPPKSDGPKPSTQSFAGVDNDMSGRPFARAPSSRQIPTHVYEEPAEFQSPASTSSRQKLSHPHNEQTKIDSSTTFVPVGAARLHLVEFPQMEMKPIYWSPVNDISTVVRATWFYKDTMLPVPASVANRLEIGYEDMRPYAETYQDELNACIEHGAAAELKVVHRLWPDATKSSRPSTADNDKTHDLSDGNGANNEDLDVTDAGPETEIPKESVNAAIDLRKARKGGRFFESHSVIYVNSREAQILRPNAVPSVSRNRRPLGSIRKGRQLGIAVVRGFDRDAWHKLHPDPKNGALSAQAQVGASMAQSGAAAVMDHRPLTCPKCEEEEAQAKVSDLVLVIHGIGQKLSERVDSYHFTHAINGLRREFNVETAIESVRGGLKEGTGIMVLPVNWRLTVKFEEEQQAAQNKYGLKDITPETLPAVRSLISDVMLDIPYYMSHHKTTMTAAVIREANRVYRLWCRNNPGFEGFGRVHIIAHSLGSVMAMEILSHQPTFVPDNLDLTVTTPSEKMFEFNTTNLFCCGSPAGFFLLLHGAKLVPRRGRHKPGMEGEDIGRGIADEAGKYGCLAVDNIYNICHRNDPVAYCQNACVDRDYAVSLQPATLPSATQSLFGRLGGSLRWTPAKAYDAYGHVATKTRPGMSHMPSTVELETHNFTQEEIAEKRMFLLNDNGQIDYFLNSGGGPLEIQYLNMLSAHSSYWLLRDFVRFLVVEIGRPSGRDHTLPALRAAKKREYKKAALN